MTVELETDDPSITLEETARAAPESYRPMVGRRSFLSAVGKLTAGATVAGGVLGLPAIVGLSEAHAQALGPLDPQQRRVYCFKVRVEAAKQEYQHLVPPHSTNGDEQLYCRKFASYSKGLIHKANGEVEPAAYQSLIHALETGNRADFDAILVGARTSW